MDLKLADDTIVLQSRMWEGNLTVEEVIDLYATSRPTSCVLDFGNDNRLLIDTISDALLLIPILVIE
jgi:hypothetical protein